MRARGGAVGPSGGLAALAQNRVDLSATTATSSAGCANTEAPASPGAERPFRDAGKLTPRQARFVDEYLIDLNATQAAIRAGYSERGAHVPGAELLTNRKVSAAVEKAMAEA